MTGSQVRILFAHTSLRHTSFQHSELNSKPQGGPNGRLRAWLNLLSRINLICPVQSHLKKEFPSRLTQITSISIDVPAHRGAFRDRHERWARDAVDAAASGAGV